MDTNLQILLIVLSVIAGAVIIIGFVLPFLKKQGIDVQLIINQTRGILATVDKTLDTVRPFIEGAAGNKLTLFDDILNVTHIGVENAEQLYNAGQLEGDERKGAAREYIVDTLKLIGVDVTNEVERVIDGAIEAEVFELKHPSGAEAEIMISLSDDFDEVEVVE